MNNKSTKTSPISLMNYIPTESDPATVQTKVTEHFHVKASSIIETGDSRWERISFGCDSLNSITNGGILTRGITEIYGESGVGKTQILLQLCLMVQLSRFNGGINKGAVFICTEDVFPSNRLYGLIGYFEKVFQERIDFAQYVFVEHMIETDDLLHCIRERLPNLLQKFRVGLVVIDSIAGVLRLESNLISRANNMRSLTADLFDLAERHRCAVVCANQIASMSNPDGSIRHVSSLGLAWANLTRTRLNITKSEKQFKHTTGVDTYCTTVRSMQVEYSPDVKYGHSEFLILPDRGVTDVFLK